MASNRSKLLWEIGVSLNEYVTKAIMATAAAKPLIANRTRWQIAEFLLRFANQALAKSDPELGRIFSDARAGKLIVTGYRRKPTQGQNPVQIPRQVLWRSQFRLLENRIEGDGFAYDDLRIVSRREIPRPARLKRPDQQSRTLQIRVTIKHLQKSGALSGKLRKQQIPIVRAALEKAGVKNIGADKSLEKIIRQITGPINSK